MESDSIKGILKENYLDIVNFVESELKHQYHFLKGHYRTLQEYKDTFDKKNECTEELTVTISKLIEFGFEVVLKDKTDYKRVNSEKGDIFLAEKIREIKCTQGQSFQGATHSSSKSCDYILIKFDVDLDKEIEDDSIKFIKGLFLCSIVLNNADWKGKATASNSRTTLRLTTEDYSDRLKNGIIHGGLVSKRILIHPVTLKI